MYVIWQEVETTLLRLGFWEPLDPEKARWRKGGGGGGGELVPDQLRSKIL